MSGLVPRVMMRGVPDRPYADMCGGATVCAAGETGECVRGVAHRRPTSSSPLRRFVENLTKTRLRSRSLPWWSLWLVTPMLI